MASDAIDDEGIVGTSGRELVAGLTVDEDITIRSSSSNNNNNNSISPSNQTRNQNGNRDENSMDNINPETPAMSETIDNSSSARPDIPKLVERGEWDEIRRWYEEHPDELSRIDPTTGSTVLHALCYAPSTPESLLKFVVDSWPDALTVQEKRFGATPLHILVWTSQRSVSKVEILLQRLDGKDTMIRNRVLGSTILHSACGNNAELSVIQAIVRKHKQIVLAKTLDQHTAVFAIWHSHMNSIPGHMQIASILRGRDAWKDNNHFQRFWSKIEFLAMEAFSLSPVCPIATNDVSSKSKDPSKLDARQYVLHGLLDLRAPLNALKVALKINPEWASVADADGNYPLHLVVKRRPFRVKDSELIRAVIDGYPQAAKMKNRDGDTPIHLGIRERMVWEEGLADLVEANVDVLQSLDTKTGMYPFMLAATLDGRVAVNTTYQLLIKKPFLVKGAIKDGSD